MSKENGVAMASFVIAWQISEVARHKPDENNLLSGKSKMGNKY